MILVLHCAFNMMFKTVFVVFYIKQIAKSSFAGSTQTFSKSKSIFEKSIVHLRKKNYTKNIPPLKSSNLQSYLLTSKTRDARSKRNGVLDSSQGVVSVTEVTLLFHRFQISKTCHIYQQINFIRGLPAGRDRPEESDDPTRFRELTFTFKKLIQQDAQSLLVCSSGKHIP